MQEHIYKHLQTEGHKGFLNGASVTFIDKIDGKDWIRTLKTMEPYGLILYFASSLIVIFSPLLFL